MTYKPTEWVNTVYDDKGNILRKGTPLMAEAMNNIEGELVRLSQKELETDEVLGNHEDRITNSEQKIEGIERRLDTTENKVNELEISKGRANGIATLDENGIVPSTQLPSNLKEIRVVPTLADRDNLEKFEGLRVMVLDASADDTVNSGWAEYVWNGTEFIKVAEAEGIDLVIKWEDVENKPTEYNPKSHSHSENDIIDLDKYTKEEVDIKLADKSPKVHSHSEKDIIDLDKYTRAEVDEMLLSKAGKEELHTHENKEILDKVTQGTLDKIDSNEERIRELENSSSKLHTHINKDTLDKIKYSGNKTNIDLILLDELENHTHNYNDLEGIPNIPSKISDLEDDSEFVKSNVGRITVSATAPSNPQENDIWIVI